MDILVVCKQVRSALAMLFKVNYFLVSVIRQSLYIVRVEFKATLMRASSAFYLESSLLLRVLD